VCGTDPKRAEPDGLLFIFLPPLILRGIRSVSRILLRVKGGLSKITGGPRCAYCGRPIRGRPYVWRGKFFCSKACKRKYRERKARLKSKRKKGVSLPKDTFGALYWRS